KFLRAFGIKNFCESIVEHSEANSEIENCETTPNRKRRPKTFSKPCATDSNLFGIYRCPGRLQHSTQFRKRNQLLLQFFLQLRPALLKKRKLRPQFLPRRLLRLHLPKRTGSQIVFTMPLFDFLTPEIDRRPV